MNKDIMINMKYKVNIYILAFLASLAGLLAGFDTGIISGAILYINKTFSLTPELSGLLVSSVSVGAIFGALINGILIDKLGRKNILLLSAIIFFFGSLFSGLSSNIYILILSRAFIGSAVGIVSFAGPLYLSEISKKEKRGAFVSLYQIAITLGILFSYITSYFSANSVFSWRLMFLIGAIPAVILFFGMLFQQDTPRWYVLKNKIELAKNMLKKLNFNGNIEKEIINIQKTLNENEKIKLTKQTIRPFIIGIGIMFAQIVTGINVIIYYTPTILKNIGFSSNENILFITVIIGIINFLMTFVATAFVDKLGRKPLLYIGLSGMLLSLIILSCVFTFNYAFLKYFAILACGLYIICFSMSLGPIALLIISEIFPLRYRGQAMSIAILSNFIFNFIATGLFPISLSNLGGTVTFLIFALICTISILFVYFIVPETKGLSLEEIEKNI